MIRYIFSTSVRRIFSCQDSLQPIITSSISVSRSWTRVVVNGPKPCGRYYHTLTLIGSKLFVFGGWDYDAKRFFNDIWSLDLGCCTFTLRFPEPFDQICLQVISNARWESYETASRNEKPLPRNCHVSVTTGDRIIMFVPFLLAISPRYNLL